MESYKEKFIGFLLNTGALRVGEDYSLKSKRISPWFVNIGDFDDGETSAALGGFYADAILNSGTDIDILYGIPEKGNAIVVATAIEMARKGKNLPRFTTRKFPKGYGEASAVQAYGDARTIKEKKKKMQHLSPEDRAKAWVIGRAPKNGQAIAELDDVFTAGDAKYEARELLDSLGDFNHRLLVIGVDRQEVGIDATGTSAIEQYEQKTGTKVVSIVNAVDVYNVLKSASKTGLRKSNGEVAMSEQQLETACRRMSNYLRVYGTQAARTEMVKMLGKLEQKIIERDRSVIPACDVSTLEEFEDLVKNTADVEGIGGYKIPAISGRKGWERWVEVARKHTNKPLIYDHQKAGTDIPDTAKDFMRELKGAGFDAVIIFPQAGPETERANIYWALENQLKVIVGGRMTHPAYSVSEGGFITDSGAFDIYRIGARAGLTNYVAPGNKPEVIEQIKEIIEGEGITDSEFYSPGLITQGGNFSAAAKAAGDRFHGIVGRAFTGASDKKAAAREYTSQLN